ncbi:transcriptional regulator [Solibacillus ferritrahens]|uniref:transcriptional regulator n=1 Tax=Solibacillus ferritrahens TaxID=3098620 RepID=UPI0030095357
MIHYEEGYSVYVEKCEQFGLEPVNFRYFVNMLSPQQLLAYYNYAIEQEMK